MSSLHKFVQFALITGCLAGGFQRDAQAQTSGSPSTTKRAPPSRPTGTATKNSGASAGTSAGTKAAGAKAPATKAPAGQAGAGTSKVAAAPGRVALENQKPAAPAQNKNQPAAPKGQPFRIPKLTPELEKILVEWEQKSAMVNRLEGKFERRKYNGTFEVEEVSEGRFCFEYPDKGSMHQVPVKVPEGARGTKWPEKPGEAQRWVVTGTKIIKIDDKAKQYEEVTIPEEDRGENIRNSPLPFVFGMKAAEAKQRYYFELVEKGTNERQIQLKVKPLTQKDLQNYLQADVILDRATFIPLAVKLHDTSGENQDMYLFPRKELTINKQGWSSWFKANPLEPNLASYKKLVEPVGAGAQPGTQLVNQQTGRRSAQVAPAGKAAGPRQLPKQTAERLEEEDAPQPPRANTKGRARLIAPE